MKEIDLESLSTAELVEHFAEICIARDRLSGTGRIAEIKRLSWQMKAIDDELRRRGRDDRLALQTLYDHPNKDVRLHAAKLTLGVAPVAARQVIEAISRSVPIKYAADARMTLWNLDEGVFKPD